MTSFFRYFLIIIISAWSSYLFTGCAVIVPPEGGPRDTLPPNLVSATPKDSSVNFTGKKIELIFDEYITLQNVQQNLIVSPVVTNIPAVSSYLNKITISIKEPLKPNTTYSFDFGNSIQDANEGNPFKNYTYAISTGSHLDSATLSGRITLAQTGGVDSTLLAVLYSDLSDTAIYKNQPEYYTRVDTTGRFTFNFLPDGGKYHLFAVENSYLKNYADTTQLFGFYDTTVTAGVTDSVPIRIYAFSKKPLEEVERPKRMSAKQLQQLKDKQAKEPLNVSVSAKSASQSLLEPLRIEYSKPLRIFNADSIVLTDTNFNIIPDYSIERDPKDTINAAFLMNHKWIEEKDYRLIINRGAAIDSFDIQIAKADTASFKVRSTREYASFTLIFPDVELEKNPVVQLIKNNEIVDALPVNNDRRVVRELYEPGEYQLRILYDTNKNNRWDPGDYGLRKQPELVVTHSKTITLKPYAENELEIYINQ